MSEREFRENFRSSVHGRYLPLAARAKKGAHGRDGGISKRARARTTRRCARRYIHERGGREKKRSELIPYTLELRESFPLNF